MIILNDLSTGYIRSKKTFVVSRNLNLKASSSELTMVMGPNGCGKSTLIRTISGIQKAILGNVVIDGNNISDLSLSSRAKIISMVLTDRILINNMTVNDVVSTGRYPYIGLYGNLSKEDKYIVSKYISLCNISHIKDKIFVELSDGEKQRVMIARALTQETPVIILDEPTAHLDLPSRIDIIMMLRDMAHSLCKTILVISHELEFALQWADRIWLMNKDGIVYDGVPEDLVLQGAFNKVFSSDVLKFDINSARFIQLLPKSEDLPIFLDLDDTYYLWLERALERIGVSVSSSDDNNRIIVSRDKNEFILYDKQNRSTDSFNNVESMLRYLSSIKVNNDRHK